MVSLTLNGSRTVMPSGTAGCRVMFVGFDGMTGWEPEMVTFRYGVPASVTPLMSAAVVVASGMEDSVPPEGPNVGATGVVR